MEINLRLRWECMHCLTIHKFLSCEMVSVECTRTLSSTQWRYKSLGIWEIVHGVCRYGDGEVCQYVTAKCPRHADYKLVNYKSTAALAKFLSIVAGELYFNYLYTVPTRGFEGPALAFSKLTVGRSGVENLTSRSLSPSVQVGSPPSPSFPITELRSKT